MAVWRAALLDARWVEQTGDLMAAEMAAWWVCQMVDEKAVMWVPQQVVLTADETVDS